MARKTRRKEAARMSAKSAKVQNRSVLTNKQIYLNRHDEEKLLLFASGILFGIGISSTLMGILWYTGIALLAFGLVLLFIEARQ